MGLVAVPVNVFDPAGTPAMSFSGTMQVTVAVTAAGCPSAVVNPEVSTEISSLLHSRP